MGECFRVVVLLLVAGVVTVVTVTPAVVVVPPVCCCVAPATEASGGAPAAELRVPEGDVRTSAALARKSSPPLSIVARQSIGIHIDCSICNKQVPIFACTIFFGDAQWSSGGRVFLGRSN